VALLSLSNDGTLTLTAWTRRDTSAALTAGTVTWAIYGPTGAAVSGATGSLTHTSGGTYTGTVESSTFTTTNDGTDGLLRANDKYLIVVTAVQGSVNAEFTLPGYVQRRGGS
jgi:hypothetical protein